MALLVLGATLLEWVVFIWICFSIPLYIIVLFIFIKHRKEEPFNQPFFKICISVGVIDMALVIVGYPVLHFRRWGWIDWSPLYRSSAFGWWFRLMPYALIWFFSSARCGLIGVESFCEHRISIQRCKF